MIFKTTVAHGTILQDSQGMSGSDEYNGKSSTFEEKNFKSWGNLNVVNYS